MCSSTEEVFVKWFNEPKIWNERDGELTITTDAKTDFWRKTHYGFIRDNGHFYYQEVTGDFICNVTVRGAYRDLYDQAGLMLRLDEMNWLKCGIEFVDGVQQASAVVTRDYSDWSVVPLASNPEALQLRLERTGGTVEVSYALQGSSYTLLRLAYLEAPQLKVGVMCASPEGTGFPVTFEAFSVQNA